MIRETEGSSMRSRPASSRSDNPGASDRFTTTQNRCGLRRWERKQRPTA
jgi:hypothetical protein